MIRKLLVLLAVQALLLAGAARAEGNSVDCGPFTYVPAEDGAVRITGWSGEGVLLEIPAELDGRPVTEIGEYAFSGNIALAGVTVPEGVKAIGSFAFAHCPCLARVSLPASLTDMGSNPFADCAALTEIDVSPGSESFAVTGGGLLRLKDRRLVCCPAGIGVDTYAIPDGTEKLGFAAFEGCDFREVIVPDSVMGAEMNAFAGMRSAAMIRIGGYAYPVSYWMGLP